MSVITGVLFLYQSNSVSCDHQGGGVSHHGTGSSGRLYWRKCRYTFASHITVVLHLLSLQVTRVDPSTVAMEFSNIVSNPVIATNVTCKLILHNRL